MRYAEPNRTAERHAAAGNDPLSDMGKPSGTKPGKLSELAVQWGSAHPVVLDGG